MYCKDCSLLWTAEKDSLGGGVKTFVAGDYLACCDCVTVLAGVIGLVAMPGSPLLCCTPV